MSEDAAEIVKAVQDRARMRSLRVPPKRSSRRDCPLCGREMGPHESFQWVDRRRAHITCPRAT